MWDISKLTFVESIDHIEAEEKTTVCIQCDLIKDRWVLFDIVSKQLNFPAYFGNNWDALADCLLDSSIGRVRIIHNGLPSMLGKHHVSVYLQILIECIENWDLEGDHRLVAIFPVSCREEIHHLLDTF